MKKPPPSERRWPVSACCALGQHLYFFVFKFSTRFLRVRPSVVWSGLAAVAVGCNALYRRRCAPLCINRTCYASFDAATPPVARKTGLRDAPLCVESHVYATTRSLTALAYFLRAAGMLRCETPSAPFRKGHYIVLARAHFASLLPLVAVFPGYTTPR